MEEKEYNDRICPRCGYEATYFDRLSIQPNHVPEQYLLPVHKCPECKHLWALVPEAWLVVLREHSLIKE